MSKEENFTIEEIETQAEEVRQALDSLNDYIEQYRVAKKYGRSALKCGVVKSAVMRGKSCHTATWRLSENSSIHTGVRAHHRCMTFFGVTSDFDHNSRHLTPTTLNCGATEISNFRRNTMNYKQKFGYTALGAAIILVGMVVGSIVSSPLVAQHNGVFDGVKCRRLTVVDEAENREIILNQKGIVILDKAGQPAIGLSSVDDGNSISIFGEDGHVAIGLMTGEEQDAIVLSGNLMKKNAITLVVRETANAILINNKTGESAITLLSSNHSLLGNDIVVHDQAGNTRWTTKRR